MTENMDGNHLDAFFAPSSIAVVGATASPLNLGATICRLLEHLSYPGRRYAVNPRGETVDGTPGYSSILDLPEAVDLAVIIVSAPHVPEVVRQCALRGIRHLIIESAGFAEAGNDGLRLQSEIDEICRTHDIRYMGPNCLGVLNTHNRFCCFFGAMPGKYGDFFAHPGSVSFIVQSGGVAALMMDSLQSDLPDISKVVSIGNKADLDEADLIEHFSRDGTEVIGLYLENIRDGRRLLDTARRCPVPILAYKVGRTEAGSRAALSHTAGMAGNDAVFDRACTQAGIIRVERIAELHSLPKIFTTMPLLKGKRIAVFTNTGAFGGITGDLLCSSGLQLAELSPATREKLRQTGQLYNDANPIDLGPALSAQTYRDIFKILLEADEVDGLLPIPNVWHDLVIDVMHDLLLMCRTYDKPAAIYIPNAVERIIAIRREQAIPSFESPEEAVRALVVSHEHFYRKGHLAGEDRPLSSRSLAY